VQVKNTKNNEQRRLQIDDFIKN